MITLCAYIHNWVSELKCTCSHNVNVFFFLLQLKHRLAWKQNGGYPPSVLKQERFCNSAYTTNSGIYITSPTAPTNHGITWVKQIW